MCPLSSFCYFIEVDQGSGFTSIPAGFYWVVVTMTTVTFIVILMILDATTYIPAGFCPVVVTVITVTSIVKL